MQEDVFADAIGEIQVTNTVVRIDFVSLSPTERDANNNPKAVFRQRIVMPVDAFSNSADLIRRVAESLLKPERPTTGNVSAGTCRIPMAEGAPSSNSKSSEVSPSSPNFGSA